jgi:hypothetical protein
MAKTTSDERDVVRKYLAYLAKGWVIPHLSREEIKEWQRRYPDDFAKAPVILKPALSEYMDYVRWPTP